MKKQLLLAAACMLFSAAGVMAQSEQLEKKDLRQLAKLMAGDYSNEAQAAGDSTYFSITLRMKPIWKKDQNGYWLYVEQAVAESQDAPYRQRVYHVYLEDDTTIVSKVYEIAHPLQYAGGWKDEHKLAKLTRDSLIDREGCGIYLHKNGNTYSGSTPGKACLSSLRGATYATSEVRITPERIESWDRGWNGDDKQVWGAVKAGYVFVRKKSLK